MAEERRQPPGYVGGWENIPPLQPPPITNVIGPNESDQSDPQPGGKVQVPGESFQRRFYDFLGSLRLLNSPSIISSWAEVSGTMVRGRTCSDLLPGVVGLAIAERLARRFPRRSTYLVERNPTPGEETRFVGQLRYSMMRLTPPPPLRSSRNSEVIHAGLIFLPALCSAAGPGSHRMQ